MRTLKNNSVLQFHDRLACSSRAVVNASVGNALKMDLCQKL